MFDLVEFFFFNTVVIVKSYRSLPAELMFVLLLQVAWGCG